MSSLNTNRQALLEDVGSKPDNQDSDPGEPPGRNGSEKMAPQIAQIQLPGPTRPALIRETPSTGAGQ